MQQTRNTYGRLSTEESKKDAMKIKQRISKNTEEMQN